MLLIPPLMAVALVMVGMADRKMGGGGCGGIGSGGGGGSGGDSCCRGVKGV